MTPDRYTCRKVVNDLVDMLLKEGVDNLDILEQLELSDSEIEYFDLGWLKHED